jgi:hypothetical protein
MLGNITAFDLGQLKTKKTSVEMAHRFFFHSGRETVPPQLPN